MERTTEHTAHMDSNVENAQVEADESSAVAEPTVGLTALINVKSYERTVGEDGSPEITITDFDIISLAPSSETKPFEPVIDYTSALGRREPYEWRKQEEEDVSHYIWRQNELIDDRLDAGRDQYGTGQPGSLFKGSPIKHLKMEAGDILHYAEWTERQLQAYELMLNEANQLLWRLLRKIPKNGPITTANAIRKDMHEDVQKYLNKVRQLELMDMESQYQWVNMNTEPHSRSG